MKLELTALLADCKTYVTSYQKVAIATTEQTEYYQQIREILPFLQSTISKLSKKEVSAAIDFNELYNKNFTYFNKFTKTSQGSIKHILAYQKIAQKMAKLYTDITPETIQRQGDILANKKKDVDKWLLRFQEQLSSTENQIEVEKRFQELLKKANQALTAKGLATV